MRILNKTARYIKDKGPIEFVRMGYIWSKRRILKKTDRYLRMRGVVFSAEKMRMPRWIKISFGRKDQLETVFTEDERIQVMSEAETICQRRFRILGSDEQVFGDAIDWHKDFKSGYSWPLSYYSDIEASIGNTEYFEGHADIKVPWELSRMQHHVTLGQAYALSGNRKFYEEFRRQVEDWIRQNPYKMGPNWACTMDVAIRAVNWTVAAVYFKEEIEVDQGFSQVLLNHLSQTGKFIESNLECDAYGHGNNHLMANLTGLVFVGLLLAGTAPQGNKWLEQGISGIESEIQYQVNSDGGSFEGSLSYHRLTTEMILFSAVILRQNGYAFSEQTRVRLEKMCDFIQSYTKPNGKAPLIGDADDGRLLTLGTYCYEDKRDHRHLLGTAGVFFDRMDFFRSAGSELTEMKWLYGSDRPSGHGVARQSYAAYPETGIYIYTDEEVYLIVRCGPVGTKGRGGHDHNDQLSFELNIRGADIVVDPGTFVYTASREERQHFRSISAHNVPQYAHYEQNTLRNETLTDLFRMETAYAGNCIKSVLTPEGFYFEGTMQYEDSGVSLRRSITVNRFKRAIEIHDVFEGLPRDGFHSERLHLSKDVSDLRISGNEARLGTNAGEVSMTAAAPIHSKVSRISEAYGAFYNGVCLEWPLTQSSSCTLCY